MCLGSDGYICPSDEDIIDILKAVDCTNIRQTYIIDACSIPPEIARWSNLVWFQCPWVDYRYDSLPGLILDFLRSAANNCDPGTYVCVGITTHEDYMHRYCLERIFGADLNTLDQYVFLGVDDVLIDKLLSYGYKHESIRSDRDIHDYIKDYHVTLVEMTYVMIVLVSILRTT